MKVNLYYRHLYKRVNAFKEFTLHLFLAISSWPRLLLEVFVRRDFGERYFSLASALTIAVLLGLLPPVVESGLKVLARPGRFWHYVDLWPFLGHYLTWYGFIAAFLMRAMRRQREIVREPASFDFARFSLSTGRIHPRFYEFKVKGQPVDVRTIETWLEPGFFFVVGFLLWLVGQPVGLLLLWCSVVYGMSYQAAYYLGDQFVLDKIDEMIANRQLVNSFVHGLDAGDTQGFRHYGLRPADPDFRRELADTFIVREESVEAV